MSEDQIEREVEARTDRLDAVYMAGGIDGQEYARRSGLIAAWADARYAEITRVRRVGSFGA